MKLRIDVIRVAFLAAAGGVALAAAPQSQAFGSRQTEDYIHVPMPPHIRVEATELDGPVFADAKGHTLYRWPFKNMRVGNTGDAKGESKCTDVKTTENTGYMSPYPGGFTLPDLDQRPSCAQAWPPALAPANAKPVGKWTVITRKDGSKQWAFDGFALYTSILDKHPGDVLGGDSFEHRGDDPAVRTPEHPPADLPPGFSVATTRQGRLLLTERNFAIYASDSDAPNKSNCDSACAKIWLPMLAPQSAHPHGDWSIFERSPGLSQWAFRKKPLYRFALDSRAHSFEGSDEPGWHNVFTQTAPPPPAGFTVQNTTAGQVLADSNGKTVYMYSCGDDAVDQLECDHPSQTQAYRLAMCGAGDPDRCLRTFPYVLAPKGAKSGSTAWSVMYIDPKTGRVAKPDMAGALRVWAYRDRPVYTYAGDERPGDTNADGLGEFRGERQGFKAYWVRDDFNRRAG
jgi:predicted lipoprotein with Yx(FWY)xxD motif